MSAVERRVNRRELQLLLGVLGVAFLVSIVHYADNFANYADYPQPTSGSAPSQDTVGISWFVFTAFGVAGLLLFLRGQVAAAAAGLALYSVSGLVGLGHYTVPGALDMPWWRQVHIVADIACGIAVFAFAVWVVWRRENKHSALSARRRE